jgi:hypothetical protein
MNNTFELKRFGLVFKKLIFERALHLIGSFILVALFTWYIYRMTTGNTREGMLMPQLEAFGIGLVLGGIYWTFTAFSYFSNKTEGSNYLLLPASHLEKWLCGVLTLTLFMVVFCLFFRGLDAFYMAKFRENLNSTDYPFNYDRLYNSAKVMDFWGNNALHFLYFVFFNLTATMAVGALYFNKVALIKTIFASIGLFFFFTFLNAQITKTLFHENINPILVWQQVILTEKSEIIQLSPPISMAYFVGFHYILPIGLWLIALVRLREKEL